MLSVIAHYLHVAHLAEPHPSPHKILTGEDRPEDPRITAAKIRIEALRGQRMRPFL